MKEHIIFLAVIILVKSATIPICKEIKFTGAISDSATNETVLALSFDLENSYDKNNQTFPNKLYFKNFEWNSIHSISFQYIIIVEDYSTSFFIGNLENDTVLPFRNREIHYSFNFGYNHNRTTAFSITTQPLFVNDGTIFDGIKGQLFDEKDNQCFYEYDPDMTPGCDINEQ